MYLLHGDLHHENILIKESQFLVIDPKGVIGPLEYEISRFIINPIPDLLQQSDPLNIIKKRMEIFCTNFNLKEENLLDWVFIQIVISSLWAEQDNNQEILNYCLDFIIMLNLN